MYCFRSYFSQLLIITGLLLISINSKAQVKTGPVPDWIQPVDLLTAKESEKSKVTDGYCYLLKDIQFNVGRNSNFYRYARKIYTSSGVQYASEISVTFDPTFEKLLFHKVVILRNGKEINKLVPSKFKVIQREAGKESYLYDGSLTAHLILEDVREGDIIEYSFSLNGINPIYNNKFFTSLYIQNYDPVGKLFVRCLIPVNRMLNIKNESPALEQTVIENGNELEYIWQQENIDGLAMDSEVPSWYDPYPALWLSEYNSWEEVKQWALPLYQPKDKLSEGLSKRINSIKDSFATDEERIKATLSFVQNEIRYTGLEAGISGYKPTSPSTVFARRFGDCKDKSLLFCQALNSMNIEAWPALLHTSAAKSIVDYLPSPMAFNHCVAVVKHNGVYYWYDPTYTFQQGKFDKLYFPYYQKALVLNEEETDLVNIPVSANSQSTFEEIYTIEKVGGPAYLSVKSVYKGYEAENIRSYFHNNRLEEIEKGYLNYVANSFPKISSDAKLTFTDDSIENVFTTYEKYIIPDFWIAKDSTKPNVLECNTYAQLLRDKIKTPKSTIRSMPYVLEYPLSVEHIVKFKVPEPWTVEEIEKTINGPGIKFDEKITYQNDTISLFYSYQTLKDHIDTSELAEFIKRQNEITNRLGYSLTYNNTLTAGTSGSDKEITLNWKFILISLLALGLFTYLAIKVYHYDPVPRELPAVPETINGLLILLAIGLILSPFMILFDIVSYDYYDQGIWNYLTDESSSVYNPLHAYSLAGELVFNIFSFVFSGLLFVLFYQRRSSFPLLLTIYYAVACIFIFASFFLYEYGNFMGADNYHSTFEIFANLKSLFWIAYINLSSRVKNTFVFKKGQTDKDFHQNQ